MARGYIRRRSNGSFQIQLYLGKDPFTGKEDYFYETVKGSRADADRRNAELHRELYAGTLVGTRRGRKFTVADYMRLWLKDYAAPRVSARTLEGYRGNVERYVIPYFGKGMLAALDSRRIREFESFLLRRGGTRVAGLSPRTVGQVHRILSMALGDAQVSGLLGRNPALGVRPPRVFPKEMQSLGWRDLHRFLSGIGDSLLRAVVLLAVQTGLRRSELLGLRWRDVDLESARLSVRRALIRLENGRLEVMPPKSRRGRMVELSPDSVDLLKGHKEDAGRFRPPREAGDFIFCRLDGSAVDPDFISGAFRRAAEKQGLKGFRFHDLRHTHASLLLEANVHLKVVSERLGHSGIGITADFYSHVEPGIQSDAAERFGEAWRRSSKGVGEEDSGDILDPC